MGEHLFGAGLVAQTFLKFAKGLHFWYAYSKNFAKLLKGLQILQKNSPNGEEGVKFFWNLLDKILIWW
jgi:hypothetical protein